MLLLVIRKKEKSIATEVAPTKTSHTAPQLPGRRATHVERVHALAAQAFVHALAFGEVMHRGCAADAGFQLVARLDRGAFQRQLAG
ncbi:hypothetical protein [Rhodanobacter terrae]|uniref:Uncharacterized protein n=1 Tax=Rhodanobacter terrae TaxID=418647 RepID=A0ABW0SYF6_9GAMM